MILPEMMVSLEKFSIIAELPATPIATAIPRATLSAVPKTMLATVPTDRESRKIMAWSDWKTAVSETLLSSNAKVIAVLNAKDIGVAKKRITMLSRNVIQQRCLQPRSDIIRSKNAGLR
jgi:hypothetical protein